MYVLRDEENTGYTVISLFAGAGGTALGLENAGLSHLMLNELNKDALATLQRNRPAWNVVPGDVSGVDFTQFKGRVDVIEGGFPCQSFSHAGKRLGLGDARGTLFFELARAVSEAQPKIVVGENVRGLVDHNKGNTLWGITDILRGLGYRVAHRVVRSQYLNVPQKRERLIIIGVRSDVNTPILYPKEKEGMISLREALRDVPESPGHMYSPKRHTIMSMVPPGGYWRDLPVDVQKDYMGASYFLGGGQTGMARRLDWDSPSLTLMCSPSQKQTERCHPEETRPLTVREYARIQTFPDSWHFAGSTASQYKQIGNAVPVNLGYHLGRSLKAMLRGVYTMDDFQVVEEG